MQRRPSFQRRGGKELSLMRIARIAQSDMSIESDVN